MAIVMYNVLSSLATCGRLGAATVAAAWRRSRRVCLARGQLARDQYSTRRTSARRQQTSQSSVSSGRRQTCLNSSVLAHVLLVDSLVVTLVEFPTHLLFESETCRASVFWETRG